jgi:hypothetical protein
MSWTVGVDYAADFSSLDEHHFEALATFPGRNTRRPLCSTSMIAAVLSIS